MTRTLRRVLAIAFTAFASAALAQTYPSKPIHIIVPFAQGGAADLLARLVAAHLQEAWGQPAVVENRTGANGNIGMEAGARATADGHTLTLVPNGNMVVNPALFPKLPYEQKDFAAVTLIARVENILVVNPGVPAKSVRELIELAKAQPGKLSFGSPGIGSQAHLAGEYLKLMGSIDLLHIVYKGVGPAVNDLLGGQISMMFAALPSALPHMKSGKLRALGIASAQRSPVVPDVPTVAEAGLPGFEAVSWYAVMVPAATPADIIGRLHGEIVRMLKQTSVAEKLAGIGASAVGNSPAELTALVRIETARYAELFKRAGIKPE